MTGCDISRTKRWAASGVVDGSKQPPVSICAEGVRWAYEANSRGRRSGTHSAVGDPDPAVGSQSP